MFSLLEIHQIFLDSLMLEKQLSLFEIIYLQGGDLKWPQQRHRSETDSQRAASESWRLQYQWPGIHVRAASPVDCCHYTAQKMNTVSDGSLQSPETHQSTADTPPHWSPRQQEQWGRRIWPFFPLSFLACSVLAGGSLKREERTFF